MRTSRTLNGTAMVTLALSSTTGVSAQGDDEVESLQRDIQQMRQRLENMEARLEQLQSEEEGETADQPDPDTESDGTVIVPEAFAENVDQRLSELENISEDWLSSFRFGGALRMNYAWRDYDRRNRERYGDFDLELFRINTEGRIDDLLLSAEWRRYNDFQAIHHAWVGYDFNDHLQLQVGINQVPFGILPFASHSFWFGGTYYAGYEDDYDTGIKLVHEANEDWTFHYGFYKNPEYADDGRPARYSNDLVTGPDEHNAEINQFNLRAERHIELSGESASLDAGLSLQGGQIFNEITHDKGRRHALAGHLDASLGPWNFQLQGLHYDYRPANQPAQNDDFIQKGSFGFPFPMAAEADIYTANAARNFALTLGPFSGATCYNDLSYIHPRVDNSAESIQNVTGCSVAVGGVFAYFDWIAGKNMWFAGGDGLGRNAASADTWHSRFNINIGYYF